MITDSRTKCKTAVPVSSFDGVDILNESLPNTSLIINHINNNTSCITSNADINITIEDPTTPFNFAWSEPNDFTSTQEDLNNIQPGNYELTIDAGCNNPPVIEPTTILQEKSKVSLELTSVVSDPTTTLMCDRSQSWGTRQPSEGTDIG